MFNPMISLLIVSLFLIPTLMTGRINEKFIKVTLGFVVSLFSSTFILILIFIILLIGNIFAFIF